MPYFTHEGANLYYEESGQGTPLVFLHGFSWDVRQWAHQVARFSKGYRTIALDARGHGKSSLPPGKVPPDVFWRDVVALLDHLGIETAAVCGLSMGSHVAIQVAIHAPKRVDCLVLMGAICTNRFNWFERGLLPINRFSQRLMPMSWIAGCIALGLGNFSPEAKPYIRQVVRSMDHSAYNRTWKAVTSMESRDGLASISCPTLILFGEHDSMTRRQQAYLHQNIRGSRFVTVPSAHHGTNLDNPAKVEQEMDAFLQQMYTETLPT